MCVCGCGLCPCETTCIPRFASSARSTDANGHSTETRDAWTLEDRGRTGRQSVGRSWNGGRWLLFQIILLVVGMVRKQRAEGRGKRSLAHPASLRALGHWPWGDGDVAKSRRRKVHRVVRASAFAFGKVAGTPNVQPQRCHCSAALRGSMPALRLGEPPCESGRTQTEEPQPSRGRRGRRLLERRLWTRRDLTTLETARRTRHKMRHLAARGTIAAASTDLRGTALCVAISGCVRCAPGYNGALLALLLQQG